MKKNNRTNAGATTGLVWACLLVVCAAVAGCSGGAEPEQPHDEALGEAGARGAAEVLRQFDALKPEKLRVHPLTRLETDDHGQRVLVVHLELVDRYGHAGKWLARVRLEFAAEGNTSLAKATAEADLSTAEANAKAFDWITRTYVVRIGMLPAWALEKGQEKPASGVVRAAAGYFDAEGTARVLEGELKVPVAGAK